MTPDELARVAALASREAAAAEDRRTRARLEHPVAAALFDWATPVFGRPAHVREAATGYEAGQHLPFRNSRPEQPPIPGVTPGYSGDSPARGDG